MIPDSKVLRITTEVFKAPKLAVDKLDKLSWLDIKKEMTEEKALPNEVADQIGEYVKHNGAVRDILDFLKSNPSLVADQDVKAGIEDIELLLSYLEAFGISNSISFDLSLAQGLDYYTSLIFEVGSIGAGGRYDNLVADRIFTILKAQREREATLPIQEIDVYVMAFGAGKDFDGLPPDRLHICGQLWDAGIRAGFSAKARPKLAQQFKSAEDVPLAVILVFGLPDGHPEKEGVLIEKADLVAEVQKRL
ncbi:uncharacterized protein K441DRAFT_726547 [Cenococcum geophilum 1.58]|uniref:uncharacterized protein n=1 Tax=Cenococcum geophilum 1.58 TaxID=794803 RepID=UPI00358F861A|nr:hypothetical protein K441DRAFT_726547 [Cenococcum geophilum 1.58]